MLAKETQQPLPYHCDHYYRHNTWQLHTWLLDLYHCTAATTTTLWHKYMPTGASSHHCHNIVPDYCHHASLLQCNAISLPSCMMQHKYQCHMYHHAAATNATDMSQYHHAAATNATDMSQYHHAAATNYFTRRRGPSTPWFLVVVLKLIDWQWALLLFGISGSY